MRVYHELFIGFMNLAVLVAAFLGAEVDHFENTFPLLILPGGSCGTCGLFALGASLHLDMEGRARWRRRSLNNQRDLLHLFDRNDIVVFVINFLDNDIANLRHADPLNKITLSDPFLLIKHQVVLQTSLEGVSIPQQHTHQQSLQHL